jgi:hypothetical protein
MHGGRGGGRGEQRGRGGDLSIPSPALAVRGPPYFRSSRAFSPPPGQPGGGKVYTAGNV